VNSAVGLFVRQLLICLVLLLSAAVQAQEVGTIKGIVVSSWDGATLGGVTVTLRGTTLAIQTDSNGRFELKNVPPGDHVLRFSKSGFAATVVTDVHVAAGLATTVNGNLRPEFYEMEEYEVTAEEFTEQTEKILFERQQSTSLLDAIGSEQFSKLGAGDAGQIVSRVTGVSVIGGKYAVVRGLSDRYSRTLLNGVEVPSADPYRTSPQLDLFPSAMIDRISVSKTFSPDQPGATGGGAIDITTKSFPERAFAKAAFGTSYNPNSNLKNNFLASPDSSTSMFDLPSGPNRLKPALFGLETAPEPPGPASVRETQARAEQRRQQADTVANLLQDLGLADFAGVEKDSPLNTALEASAGSTVKLFQHNLGLFGGMNYRRNFSLLEEATVNRYNFNGSPRLLGIETRGNIDTDYGAAVNLGYDLSPYAQFGFNFMLAHSIDDEARHGSFPFFEGREEALETWQLHFTEREIQNYQLSGHHALPALANSKFDWVVSLANTTQEEPDHRFMNYFVDPTGRPSFGIDALPTPQFPARYFRKIEEQSLNSRVDWSLPLSFLEQDSKFKTGFFASNTDRDFQEQYFLYNLSDGFQLSNPNSYLNDPAYLNYTTTYLGGIRTNYNFSRFIDNTFTHPYTAFQDIMAGYIMGDFGLLPWLRLTAGGRLEQTLMEIEAQSGSSKIDQVDILPAASLMISFLTNFDLRLSYGETVARPSFREKANIANFLPDLGIIAFGNPALQMSGIKSYDARLEWFPGPGDVLSAGLFYKDLTGPVELMSLSLNDNEVSWTNRVTGATVLGAEFELRKSLEFLLPEFKGLTLGANITLIESTTDLTSDELFNKTNNIEGHVSESRPLYDQSPYIINLDLNYTHPTSGTSVTLGANLTGERIVLVKSFGPDVYEHPPITLDALISQRFWKYLTFRFGVRNLLDSEFLQTYGSSPNGNVFQAYKRGRTFTFSLTADF
jgi:hypothetical protein